MSTKANAGSPKPFIKWVGGKTQLLADLVRLLPPTFNNYHEPFLGGGALFFKLYSLNLITKSYLSDSNEELINTWLVIKNNTSELINELSKKDFYVNEKTRYYEIRAWEPIDPVKRAARFIYLNKTAYNGLYRVNSKGKFNVPFGRYKNPKILDEENLWRVHVALQDAEIFIADFADVLTRAKKEDLVYFDPPYHPISKSSSFTQYTKNAFGLKEQERLSKVFKELDKRGCYVILSNSNTPLIKELYSEFNIHQVLARRAINSNPNGRKPIYELVITNY